MGNNMTHHRIINTKVTAGAMDVLPPLELAREVP